MTNELVKINASDYGLEETKAAEILAAVNGLLAKVNQFILENANKL